MIEMTKAIHPLTGEETPIKEVPGTDKAFYSGGKKLYHAGTGLVLGYFEHAEVMEFVAVQLYGFSPRLWNTSDASGLRRRMPPPVNEWIDGMTYYDNIEGCLPLTMIRTLKEFVQVHEDQRKHS
jgi:hypothetical protein